MNYEIQLRELRWRNQAPRLFIQNMTALNMFSFVCLLRDNSSNKCCTIVRIRSVRSDLGWSENTKNFKQTLKSDPGQYGLGHSEERTF